MNLRAGAFFVAVFTFCMAGMAHAESTQKQGRITGLPVPRYISVNSDEAFLRRGPSQEYPIEWVYHRRGYPVRVIGESGHWRKVEDSDGARGWFHYALLSGTRTVLVLAEKVTLSKTPAENSQLVAILENGVIAELKACTPNWCEVEIQKLKGWLPKSTIWGVDADEVFEE